MHIAMPRGGNAARSRSTRLQMRVPPSRRQTVRRRIGPLSRMLGPYPHSRLRQQPVVPALGELASLDLAAFAPFCEEGGVHRGFRDRHGLFLPFRLTIKAKAVR